MTDARPRHPSTRTVLDSFGQSIQRLSVNSAGFILPVTRLQLARKLIDPLIEMLADRPQQYRGIDRRRFLLVATMPWEKYVEMMDREREKREHR